MKKRKKKKGVIKEYVFLFIGLLLLISLFICIYLVNLDRQYIHTTATIVDVVDMGETNKVTLNYNVSGDSYDYEVSYAGDVSYIEIPKEINEYQVTKIGKKAFKGNDDLVSMIVPDGVISIEEEAFGG